MSGGISISFVDFAVVSFAFDRILLRFVQVVSGAKLVRFIWRPITRGFVFKNSASGSTRTILGSSRSALGPKADINYG
jgi:hypothetical protein